ncbi:MAG TPA: HD-GYP domain-containing protein [Vicinamibacterales bacterium]|nr:HD-GYP domain-containing protein [Vicinamibacterales bacterium]
MSNLEQSEELVRRLAAAARASALYAPSHPLVLRGIDALADSCGRALQQSEQLVIGFVGDDLVVDGQRLTRNAASLAGFVRELRGREVEKITFSRGVSRDDVRTFVAQLADRTTPEPLAARLERSGLQRITIGRIVLPPEDEEDVGIAAAQRLYGAAVRTAETLWESAKAGEKPDPAAARTIINSLARLVTHDSTSLVALTSLKKYDNYTYTHMVNVAVLAMALARSLSLEGAMLREFGFAALMHDIGKVYTPLEVLNKPDRLTREEFDVMKRHVVDGAHILRRTPEVPALAPVVAFEHHLKQDLTGYPENVGGRRLNLCTMVVSVVDVFDALRSNRIYRHGLPTERVKAIMAQQDGTAFNPTLLRRFINLMGMYPVGTLVRMNTEELGVVTHEHPGDPFRPQVKVIRDGRGAVVSEPFLVNTWERDARGDVPWAVVEALDAEPLGIDPLSYLNAEGRN